jgi:hypothetical protein
MYASIVAEPFFAARNIFVIAAPVTLDQEHERLVRRWPSEGIGSYVVSGAAVDCVSSRACH